MPYPFVEIEAKWQKRWEETGAHSVDLSAAERPFYNLMEFPYPSAEALHVGHVYTYSGADTYGRYMRMHGHTVFEPMGFDAFGIHSENYALKHNINPMVLTDRNVRRFRHEQMTRFGAMFDWSHSVDTSKPEYYRWTQWVFVQLFKAGLAERKEAPVNWCPSCLTVLANEQVIDGECERCQSEVVQKKMTQWFFRITDFAQRLLDGLDHLDWPEISKIGQRNWIGRSEGAEIDFGIDGTDESFTVFTTRPDTLFGATYCVFAPEHPLCDSVVSAEQRDALADYRGKVSRLKEIERLSLEREKTGVFLGAYAINPVNGARIPIWASDYVLMQYGTGAVMAVPAHDQRDWEFARKFDLPMIEVVSSEAGIADAAYEGPGVMRSSAQFDGIPSAEMKRAVTEWLEGKGQARFKVTYRLHDWLISRQRYWGPPIPIIYCDKCGTLPVPDGQLPVVLPEVEDFRPTGTGKSPLASVADFVNTTCPQCGGPAERETDVSDTFLDSAWYFLRYTSTHRDDAPFDADLTRKWLPVDMYMGGREHICMHHLYARFVTMALYDMGYVPFEEPFGRLRLHGMIIKDGAKMSKSRGNVVNPDEYIDRYGGDVIRMYLLFLGPYEEGGDFNDRAIAGISRFLTRVYETVTGPRRGVGDGSAPVRGMHAAVKKVSEDVESLNFHTAISALMTYMNWLQSDGESLSPEQEDEALRALVLLLAPFVPHLAEELWEVLGAGGAGGSVYSQPWPVYDESALALEQVELAVQVNGKVRGRVTVPADAPEEKVREAALADDNVAATLGGKTVRKVIVVPGRVVNIVAT